MKLKALSLITIMISSVYSATKDYSYSGLQAIKTLVKTGICKKCDFTHQDLKAAIEHRKKIDKTGVIDISDSNAENQNLSCTDLDNIIANNTNFTGANFSNSSMKNITCNEADMTNAKFDKSTQLHLNYGKNLIIKGSNIHEASMSYYTLRTLWE